MAGTRPRASAPPPRSSTLNGMATMIRKNPPSMPAADRKKPRSVRCRARGSVCPALVVKLLILRAQEDDREDDRADGQGCHEPQREVQEAEPSTQRAVAGLELLADLARVQDPAHEQRDEQSAHRQQPVGG